MGKNAAPKHEFKRILVPVSGDEVSEHAFRWVCQMSRHSKAQIHAVHVIEVPMDLPLETQDPHAVDQGEAVLARMEAIGHEEKCKDVHARSLRARHVGPAIVMEAEERGMDAVVLGIPYRRKFGSCRMGDTANYIFENASCQVVFSRASAPQTVLA